MTQMTAAEAAEWGKTLSFEKVWAMFAETDRKMAESDRRLREEQAKTEKVLAELGKKVDRVCGNVGGLNRSVGELIETLIAARLWEKFPQYGFVRSYQRVPIYDELNRVRTDIDILLSNTDKAMPVEVKRELDNERDVDDHVKRMELIRKYPPLEAANKELLGAMAGGTVSSDIARYASDAGFYVLELTGESVRLIPPPDGFKPKIW
jgi:hypothetical protein